MRLEAPRGAGAMHSMTATADRDLTAIRARGRIGLDVEASPGVTRRRRVHESGSLRVRFPGAAGGELEAVTVNTGGGMTGGDAFDIDVSVGENARLVVTTHGGREDLSQPRPAGDRQREAQRRARAARSTWLPQETILFDRARAASPDRGRSRRRRAAGPGRAAGLRPHRHGRKRAAAASCTTAGACGERQADLCRRHAARRPRSRRPLAETAVANGGVAIATALVVPGDEAMADAIHAMSGEFRGEVGVSAWNGRAVVRFCARDGAALRHDITCALGRCGRRRCRASGSTDKRGSST